jgi:ubiquinol-cytochrome c reductase subunit 6
VIPAEEGPVEEAPAEESEEEETPAESEVEEDEEEEEEEEEDEGTTDPLDNLRAECANLPSIKPYLHHYEECVERVTKAQEDPDYASKEYKEDCVEEFFHLQHHINDCVQPRLFSKLK